MKFTGERVIPNLGPNLGPNSGPNPGSHVGPDAASVQVDPDLLNEHRARYIFASSYCAGKVVLDAACGAGYGSAILAEGAQRVVGIDIDAEAVEYSREHFGTPQISFTCADCCALPFPSGFFERIVAFEIIEHLKNPEAFLKELRRVLSPAGLLIISTPNRLYYTDDRRERNPFHEREFSYPEFVDILKPVFPQCEILFENHLAALGVFAPGADGGSTEPAGDCTIVREKSSSPDSGERAAHFFVALCSAESIEAFGTPPPFLYLPSTGNVLRERETHIRSLAESLRKLKVEFDEKAAWAISLETDLERARAALKKLQGEFEERCAWASRLQADLDQAQSHLRKSQQEFEDRTAWAISLQGDLDRARSALQKLQGEFDERTAWALKMESELRALYDSRWYRIGRSLRLGALPPSGNAS